MNAASLDIGQKFTNAGRMHFDTEVPRFGVLLCHGNKTVTHAKTDFQHSWTRHVKARIPIELVIRQGEAMFRKSDIPPSLLTICHAARSNNKASNTT